MFTKANPDKGTETYRRSWKHISKDYRFTKANPDKGTETNNTVFSVECEIRLQKLTPIRGRKLLKDYSHDISSMFTKANPDKGTETE